MQAEWEPDELIDAWTLTGGDWDLIANKADVTRLGFAVMLKFYEIEGRFPAYPEEVPPAAVRYLGSLVKVEPALFARYSWSGRSMKYHRSQIRKVNGTRPPTEDDEERWAQWLATELCPAETNRDRLATALRRRCRSEKVEPPSTGQVERVVASSCRQFDDAFAATTAGRLGPAVCGRLEELLSRPNVLAELKSDPGPLGLDTLLAEIGKLSMVRALGLDEAVFGGASDRIVAAWRARAARMYPSDFEDCPEPVRYTLLAALCWTRQAELVDGLAELLIGLIHRINARAERRAGGCSPRYRPVPGASRSAARPSPMEAMLAAALHLRGQELSPARHRRPPRDRHRKEDWSASLAGHRDAHAARARSEGSSGGCQSHRGIAR